MADNNEVRNPASHETIIDLVPLDPALERLIISEYCQQFIYTHECEGNLDVCRQIYNLWTNGNPDLPHWQSFIDFELRHNNIDQARDVFESLVQLRPVVDSWIRYIEFECNYGSKFGLRICGERAVQNLNDKKGLERSLLALAESEEQRNELENATILYKLVLDCIVSNDRANILYKKVIDFVKRHEEKESSVKSLLLDIRADLDSVVQSDPTNYVAWKHYIRFEEAVGDEENIRLVYKRALENVPKVEEKLYWKAYVYLWILYANFERRDSGNIDRARQAYQDCIRLIPHEKFSFSKVWVLAAEFEMEQSNTENARKVLDHAIRIAPNEMIFRKYLDMEVAIRDVMRCRTLYTKYVQFSPHDSCKPWIEYAEFEKSLNETEKARFIYELALSQPALHDSKLLWKAYTDFEISQGEMSRPREFHVNILRQRNHPNIWISYANFEAYGVQEILRKRGGDHILIKIRCLNKAREVFDLALKSNECFNEYSIPRSEREENHIIMILNEWLEVERSFEDLGNYKMVHSRAPWRLRTRKRTPQHDRSCGTFPRRTF